MSKAPKFRSLGRIPVQVMLFYWPLVEMNQKFKYLSLLVLEAIAASYTCVAVFNILSNNNWQLNLSDVKIDLVGSIILSVVFGFSLVSFWRPNKQYDFEKKKNINIELITPSEKETLSGYKSIFLNLEEKHSLIYSKEINNLLRKHIFEVKLKLLDRSYKYKLLQSKFTHEKEFIKEVLLMQYFDSYNAKHKQEFYNDKKISLKNSLYKETFNNLDKNLDVFESDYYSSYLTNDLSLKNIINNNNSMPTNIKFPYEAENTNSLQSIEDTGFSNHIGVNVIAITRDNKIKLWKQGSKALRSAGLLAPTGSGSLDFEDFEGLSNRNGSIVSLGDLIELGMRRELLEESHQVGKKINDFIYNIKVIGFYRWASKAGLPGFLGVARLTVDAHELEANISEVENGDVNQITEFDASNMESMQASISKILEMKDHLSAPLYANLAILQDTIEESPNELQFLFDEII
jgi:hypothetical protein